MVKVCFSLCVPHFLAAKPIVNGMGKTRHQLVGFLGTIGNTTKTGRILVTSLSTPSHTLPNDCHQHHLPQIPSLGSWEIEESLWLCLWNAFVPGHFSFIACYDWRRGNGDRVSAVFYCTMFMGFGNKDGASSEKVIIKLHCLSNKLYRKPRVAHPTIYEKTNSNPCPFLSTTKTSAWKSALSLLFRKVCGHLQLPLVHATLLGMPL